MRIPTWTTGFLALFLASCSSLPANDARPATDLELLRLGVQELTRERQPQGPVQRVEDAKTGEGLFGIAVELEAVNWLQNDDKARLRRFVDKGTRRIELSRLPTCGWWQVKCLLARRRTQATIDAIRTPE